MDPKKRTYNAVGRQAQAAQTRGRILDIAQALFRSEGFEGTTIEKIAELAHVSAPTIYALFQSKRGILRALMDEALPAEVFETLVNEAYQEKSPQKRLKISAKIARQIYDAERAQMEIFQGASVIAPELKELEKEREQRRFDRQARTIQMMAEEKSLAPGVNETKARDLLWALTGRDMYRMFVVERGWTSDEYEIWLGNLLIMNLVNPELISS